MSISAVRLDKLPIETEAINVFIDPKRDELLSDYSKDTLYDRYLLQNETPQHLFKRVAEAYGDDQNHAQRIYDYMSQGWFMPATPILANGGAKRGLPISCYLNETEDNLKDIVSLWTENTWLASNGGGIGSYWGNVRSIGESVGISGKTSGIVPFIRVMDSLTFAISQGSLRRGSAAAYLDVHHPEIEEFIDIRRPTGGDFNRKALNLHHGILIDDKFMHAVENDLMYDLVSPKDKKVIKQISARALWIKILTTRIETGEPYIIYIDTVNKNIPEHHKKAGLNVKTSNLCSEITLPTGYDHLGNKRTAICCLSSLNLIHYETFIKDENFIEDILRFLDNVLEDFITRAPAEMKNAIYAAQRERSIGLGVMGFHSFLQSKNVPLESALSKAWNNKIFKTIHQKAKDVSKKLAVEKGPCPDAAEFGFMERFSNIFAIAPTASISTICNSVSPGIEPLAANSFTHKTLSGSTVVRNIYLEKLLEEKGQNTPAVWSSIALHEGSVQHLDFLTEDEKLVYKTAFEIDQRWLIDLAADRTPYVCQAQSLNIFLKGNIHKKDLHHIHFSAWKKGLKAMYYCRSSSVQRADSEKVSAQFIKDNSKTTDYDECLACQ